MNPYARFSREELEHMLREYDGAVCWDTSCLTCAKLYDKLYAIEADMNRILDIDDDDDMGTWDKLYHVVDIAEKFGSMCATIDETNQ